MGLRTFFLSWAVVGISTMAPLAIYSMGKFLRSAFDGNLSTQVHWMDRVNVIYWFGCWAMLIYLH